MRPDFNSLSCAMWRIGPDVYVWGRNDGVTAEFIQAVECGDGVWRGTRYVFPSRGSRLADWRAWRVGVRAQANRVILQPPVDHTWPTWRDANA